MENFVYTTSPTQRGEIERIDSYRKITLLHLESTQKRIHRAWQATVSRTYHSLLIEDPNITDGQIKLFLESSVSHEKNETKNKAQRYKNALLYISAEWFMNEERIEADHIRKLHRIFTEQKLSVKEGFLANMLHFIQVSSDHPTIQAGLFQIMMLNILPPGAESLRFSILGSYLFLYKHGYNFNNLLVLEKIVTDDLKTFNDSVQNALQTKNLSPYLEYFIRHLSLAAEKTAQSLDESASAALSDVSTLTERQKQILTLFELPSTRISNKTIQETFGVSQITASRDLAKLANIGLIYPHGRGRSVYYTKA